MQNENWQTRLAGLTMNILFYSSIPGRRFQERFLKERLVNQPSFFLLFVYEHSTDIEEEKEEKKEEETGCQYQGLCGCPAGFYPMAVYGQIQCIGKSCRCY